MISAGRKPFAAFTTLIGLIWLFFINISWLGELA